MPGLNVYVVLKTIVGSAKKNLFKIFMERPTKAFCQIYDQTTTNSATLSKNIRFENSRAECMSQLF